MILVQNITFVSQPFQPAIEQTCTYTDALNQVSKLDETASNRNSISHVISVALITMHFTDHCRGCVLLIENEVESRLQMAGSEYSRCFKPVVSDGKISVDHTYP